MHHISLKTIAWRFFDMKHKIDGRVWVSVGLEPYTKADGTEINLRVWETECAKCSTKVRIKTPDRLYEHSKAFFTKHCDAHKGARK